MSQDHIENVQKLVGTPILCMYEYGSYVYGTNREGSDRDYFVIVANGEKYREIKTPEYDIHVYPQAGYQMLLDNHDIGAIESFFRPVVQNVEFKFELNKTILRHTLSQKSSNSYVKAQKKITVEKDRDYLCAKKSLFHSLRLLDFGTQLCKYGKINDFTSANKYFTEIMELEESPDMWNSMHAKYKPILNALSTEFKKHAPK